MKKEVEYLVVAPDGDARSFAFPEPVRAAGAETPEWLVRRMGLRAGFARGWALSLLASGDVPRLALTRRVTAGASGGAYDPRQQRLEDERQRLLRLNDESDYVRVKELDALEGSAPDHYLVILLCRGIVGVDSSQTPIYVDRHEVEIYCDMEFPSKPPRLRWLTPSWHPNIDHKTGAVCINEPEWLGGMRIDDLCRMMFEMVQYKNYHIIHTPPYPLDQTVAKWVREYAVPHGIVDKDRGIYVDNKPFTRPTVTDIRVERKERPTITLLGAGQSSQAQPAGQLRIKVTSAPEPPSQPSQHVPGAGRIRVIGKTD
jgi:ubiquitin-protein ligase